MSDIVYASSPPPGVTPNPNAAYKSAGLQACTWIFLPLAFVSLAIRLYTRARIVGAVSFDDYLMVGAMILSIAMSVFVLILFDYGLGKHMFEVPLTDLYPYFMKNNLLSAIVFCAATGFAKTSILVFYHRIFPTKTFRIVIYILIFYVAGYSAASVFVNIFSCDPVAASWDYKLALTAKCVDRPAFYFAQAGLGIVADFATLIAPVPMMMKLQLPMRQRVGIACLLTTGGFVCIISIIRLRSIYDLLKSPDLTMATAPALTWCTVELNVSILGGCISTIKPFFREHFPSLLGRSSASKSKTYASNTNRYTYTTRTVRSTGGRMSKFDPLSSTVVVGGEEACAELRAEMKMPGTTSQECIIRPSLEDVTIIDVEKGLQRKNSDGSHETDGSNQGMGIIKTMEYSHTYETASQIEMTSIDLHYD